jgi:Type IV leader peptidase family
LTIAALAAGIAFAVIGAGAERLASIWPADEASGRAPGMRTALLALGAGAAGGAIAWRSTLPAYALAVQLLILATLVLLTATDLEQRRLPHLLLDPLIVVAVLFVPFNPTVDWMNALIGGAVAVGFMGILGLVVRGGVALGDLYLVGPIGLVLGWPAIFVAVFVAGLLSAAASALFLVAGMVITLLRDPALLGELATALSAGAAR